MSTHSKEAARELGLSQRLFSRRPAFHLRPDLDTHLEQNSTFNSRIPSNSVGLEKQGRVLSAEGAPSYSLELCNPPPLSFGLPPQKKANGRKARSP